MACFDWNERSTKRYNLKMMKLLLSSCICIAWLIAANVSGFSPAAVIFPRTSLQLAKGIDSSGYEKDDGDIDTPQQQQTTSTRRTVLSRVLMGTLTVIGASSINVDQVAHAAKITYPPGKNY